jgi:DNA-binding FrmR family transcriptional regulator
MHLMLPDFSRGKSMQSAPSKRVGVKTPHDKAARIIPDNELRKAVAVDPEIKNANLNRLRRIEGQIRGLHKMVEEDRYCPDILIQISSVQEALRGVGRALMRNHLQHCATDALVKGSQEQTAETYDELLELIYRYLR